MATTTTMTTTYCASCDRHFRNSSALQMHLASSSRHKATPSPNHPRPGSRFARHNRNRSGNTKTYRQTPEPYTAAVERYSPEFHIPNFPSSDSSGSPLSSPELQVYASPRYITPDSPHVDYSAMYYSPQPPPPQTFACELCPAGNPHLFFTNQDLTDHLMTCHWWCPYQCGTAFVDEFNVQNHINQQHGYPMPPLTTYDAPEPEPEPVSMTYNGNTWSSIPLTMGAVEVIKGMCHTREVLEKANYHMQVLNPEQVNELRKCRTCNKTLGEVYDKECYFHTGTKIKTDYTCCGRHYRETPCQSKPSHTFEPISLSLNKWEFFPTPSASPLTQHRRAAVALDCEMGADAAGQPVLIQLSVVDYFTGETLINSLIKPDRPAKTLNTRFSGVTQQMMADALSSGNILHGSAAAREELWRHIDADTVLVGHALNNDLNVLHLIHPNIVDSCILVPTPEGMRMSLKALSKELLEKNVQRGKTGHDCVEDALAAREVVIWCSNHLREVTERRAVAEVQVAARLQAKLVKEQEKRERRVERDRLVGPVGSGLHAYGSIDQLRAAVAQISLAMA